MYAVCCTVHHSALARSHHQHAKFPCRYILYTYTHTHMHTESTTIETFIRLLDRPQMQKINISYHLHEFIDFAPEWSGRIKNIFIFIPSGPINHYKNMCDDVFYCWSAFISFSCSATCGYMCHNITHMYTIRVSPFICEWL